MYYSIKWTKLGLGNFLSLEIRAVSKNVTFDLTFNYIYYMIYYMLYEYMIYYTFLIANGHNKARTINSIKNLISYIS